MAVFSFTHFTLGLGVILLLLTGCSNRYTKAQIDHRILFHDAAFERPEHLPDPAQVFILSAIQQNQISSLINFSSDIPLATQLINKLLKDDYGSFDYDNSYTRTASETFEVKQGNCLSMVIMTVAIAQQLGINYRVQDLAIAPVWSRDGGLFLINGHINIQLNRASGVTAQREIFVGPRYVTLDFIPSRAIRNIATTRVSQARLVAMYFVNLAAETMVKQQWDLSYYLLKLALESDHSYSAAWNSLAVVYRYREQLMLAEKVYRYAMLANPDDLNLIANFSLLLESQGRFSELFEYQRRYDLAQLHNPYHYYDLAEIALAAQQYQRAIKYYKQAIDYSSAVDQFYFGLFKSYYLLGQWNTAQKYLVQARKYSATIKNRQRYNAKLMLLSNR